MFLVEQFLETVTTELRIWLVDQKPKTIDEMGKLADQYVALRKQINQPQSSSVSSSETHQDVSHNRGAENTSSTSQRPYKRYQRNSDTSFKKFFKHSKTSSSPKSNTVSYAYCKLPNHTVSQCRKLKQKQDKDKPQSSVNANSFASLSPVKCPVLHTTQSKDAEQPVYPHFAPYCKTATIVRQDGSHKQITTLRDTGAMQSLLKAIQVVMTIFTQVKVAK